MRTRGLLALVAVVAMVAGGVALRSVKPRAAAVVGPTTAAFSGTWFCPHGGGHTGWRVELSVTNPGPRPVPIRVTPLDEKGSGPARGLTLPPGSTTRIPVPARSRGASSTIDYFGGWVAAGWVAVASGGETGLASEPCVSSLGKTWFMPDGTTIRGQDAWVIVQNPTAEPAVFSLRLVTERRVVLTKDWSAVVLNPHRSRAFHLNDKALGERTVSAELETSIGRVAAGALGTSSDGGIRSAIAIPAPESAVTIPSGPDAGRTELVVENAGTDRATFGGTLERTDGAQALGQLGGGVLQADEVKTYDVTTPPLSAVEVTATRGELAVGRRSFGAGGDQGSSMGGTPGPAWVVFSAGTSPQSLWRLILANPGKVAATVRVALYPASGRPESPRRLTFRVPAGRTRGVDAKFTQQASAGAVVLVATRGTFVPIAASFTANGSGYSVATGVPIPARWVGSAAG